MLLSEYIVAHIRHQCVLLEGELSDEGGVLGEEFGGGLVEGGDLFGV